MGRHDGPPTRLGPASKVVEGPGRPGTISRGWGQRGLTAAIRLLFPSSCLLFFPFPWLWVGASAFPVLWADPAYEGRLFPWQCHHLAESPWPRVASLLRDLQVNLLPALLALTRHLGGIFQVCVGFNNSYQ